MLTLELNQIIIQIIAFLIMLWVMKRYGWQPLLNIMEARQRKIQEEFDFIAEQKENVKKVTREYEEKIRKIDADARHKLRDAVNEGRRISEEIQEEAHAKSLEILQNARADVDGEIIKAKNALKNDMVKLVISVTEKILKEKLDASSQKNLITNFIEEVQLK